MIIEQLVGDRLYLDTNVFIYLVEDHPDFAGVLRALFVQIDEHAIEAVTSELTLAEVMIKPIARRRPDLAATYDRLLAPGASMDMRPVDRATLLKSAELCAHFGGTTFDAIHVATACLSGCDYLVSEDRDLLVPPPLQHLRLSELRSI